MVEHGTNLLHLIVQSGSNSRGGTSEADMIAPLVKAYFQLDPRLFGAVVQRSERFLLTPYYEAVVLRLEAVITLMERAYSSNTAGRLDHVDAVERVEVTALSERKDGRLAALFPNPLLQLAADGYGPLHAAAWKRFHSFIKHVLRTGDEHDGEQHAFMPKARPNSNTSSGSGTEKRMESDLQKRGAEAVSDPPMDYSAFFSVPEDQMTVLFILIRSHCEWTADLQSSVEAVCCCTTRRWARLPAWATSCSSLRCTWRT